MSERISKISFKNYKSFEGASIDLAPLSILVGANSTGKSALLKLILLLSQSLSSDSVSLFTYNGSMVEMGEVENIFPGYDKDVEMEFKFHYQESFSISSPLESFYGALRASVRRDLATLGGDGGVRTYSAELRSRISATTDFEAFELAANLLDKYVERADEGDSIDGEGVISKDYKALAFASRIAMTLSRCEAESIEYKVRHKSGVPVIAKVIVKGSDGEILHYRPTDHKNLGARLAIRGVDQRKLVQYYRPVRDIVRPVSFRFMRRPAAKGLLPSQTALVNPVGFLVGTLLAALSRPVYQTFVVDRVRHVSPLRAYPRRYYLLDGRDYEKAETERVISLLRDRPGIVKEINKWLGLLGHSVELEQIHESIFRIMVNNGKLNSDLTDVGFGLSQILPVILEPIISEEGDLILVQQPEIHLHPKAQSILADFFIWAVKEKGCNLIVETHSEYLLRRLRRRLGEGVFNPGLATGISRENISLMSIEKIDGVSVVNKLALDESGDFKWPADFIDDEVEDLLAFVEMAAETDSKTLVGGVE